MFDEIYNKCHQFYIAATAAENSDIEKGLAELSKAEGKEFSSKELSEFSKKIEEFGKSLKAPEVSDQEDIKILLNRAVKFISAKEFGSFYDTMVKLDKLIKQFMPEKFDPEFADFITDQDTWEWVYQLKNKKLFSKNDLIFISILKNELLYILSKPNLIISGH